MISQNDITLALVAHCKAADDWFPVVYPNKNDDRRRPKIYFENVVVSVTDRTMDGAAEVTVGYLQLTIVIERDAFTNEAEKMGDTIRRHFQYPTTKLDVTGGKIRVTKPPQPLQGFPDKDATEYRIPVRIDYRAQ